MCEHSSVSPAVALREARRQKILENSAKRLKLIEDIKSSSAGQKNSDPKPQPEVRKTNTIKNKIPSSEIQSKLTDFHETNKELKKISDFLLQDINNIQVDEVEEELNIRSTDVQERNFFKAFFNNLIQKKLHYVLLALTVNILLYLNVGFLFYENIFCPFYSLKAIELISARRERESFQPLMLLFIAGLPKSLQKLTKITLNFFLTLISDLCIYLFTFIIGTKIINSNQL